MASDSFSHRFQTAVDGAAPTEAQAKQVRMNHMYILAAAKAVDEMPESRQKSLALTKLEEALMWANKAVFS